MSRLPRKGKLSHGLDRTTSAEDERRLFPGHYKTPKDGVPIVPSGSSSHPNPKSKFKNIPSFKPVDNISNARESGPVRAQGKPRPPRADNLNASYPENASTHPSERPSKRQRRNSSETAPATSVIVIPSDDDTGPPGMESSSMAGQSARRSSFSSQLSNRTRRMLEAGTPLGTVHEFRDVERSVQVPRTPKFAAKRQYPAADDDVDEKFTENAARERRSRFPALTGRPSPKQGLGRQMRGVVEGPVRSLGPSRNNSGTPPGDRAGTMGQGQSPGGRHRSANEAVMDPPPDRFPSRDRGRKSPTVRNLSPSGNAPSMDPPQDQARKVFKPPTSDHGESSDELQGEVTVKHAPAAFARDHTRSVSSGAKIDETSKIALPSRSNSPETSAASKLSRQKKDKLSKKKSKAGKKEKGVREFQAIFFRKGPDVLRPPDSENIRIEIETKNKTMKVYATASDEVHTELDLNKIDHFAKGDDSSRKISLHMSKSGNDDNRVDIELLSPEEKDSLLSVLEKRMEVKVQIRPGAWMDKAFTKKEKQSALQINGAKRPSEGHTEQPSEAKAGSFKRRRLQDSLKNYRNSEEPPSDSEHRLSSPSNPLPPAAHRDSPASENHQPPPSSKPSDNAVDIPVKKFIPKTPAIGRATRSMSRREEPATVVFDDDDESFPTPNPKGKVQKWHKPLVYPRLGKKKAEVDIQDLERLRESEFLNDNLIGFYIRFLEDHLDRRNEEVSKRVYFFNSYFFATLTNIPRRKKGINYEGVEKWTRNVNLFNYDYIVVPINENAHWYVAIICNLPVLQRISKQDHAQDEPEEEDDKREQPEGDEQVVSETPEASQQPPPGKEESSNQESDPGKEESTRQRLASMSLSERDLPRHGDEAQPTENDWPSQEENPTSSPAKFSPAPKSASAPQADSRDPPGLRGSPRKPLRKSKRKLPPPMRYDVNQPIIVTFDSLNMGRSPTISTLREYLCAEARSKQGMEIDKTLIKGMKAREIPLQPNFSDCGLYLLAYVEKFVQDPDTFIRRLLRKEMDEKADWPRLRPGLLRARLRDFLDDLYDEQIKLSLQPASEQELMVDQRPITYLLGSSEHEKSDNAEAQKSPEEPVKSDSPRAEDAAPPAEASELPNGNPASESEHTKAPETAQCTEDSPPGGDEVLESDGYTAKKKAEVVEVPDSQERDYLPVPPPSPPKVLINYRANRQREARQHEAPKREKTPIAGPREIPETNTEEPPHHSAVEVQVVRPPSSPSAVKRSPKASRHKPKHAPE
ncbi:hypothetical protein BDV59DRAFT_175579 [Aspergillus ambiguus]|uniref:SUMO protease ULP2 n=1 Tax=Aspergillus ambiguus TaxID=176160 RepID=UPI003CCDABFD